MWRKSKFAKLRWSDLTFSAEVEEQLREAALEVTRERNPDATYPDAEFARIQRAYYQQDVYKSMTADDLIPTAREVEVYEREYVEHLQHLERRRESAALYVPPRPAEGPRLYGAEEVRERVLSMALELAPRLRRRGGFVLDRWNQTEFDALCLYFGHDPGFERLAPGYSLDKFLLLQGNVGTGKSTMLQIFCKAQITTRTGAYGIGHCRDVSKAWRDHGHKGLAKYLRGAWFLDDLGTEDIEVNYYSTYIRPLAEVLTTRYDEGVTLPLHFTTNNTEDQLLAKYDRRAFDRLAEDYNFLDFHPDAPSRRSTTPTAPEDDQPDPEPIPEP